MTASRWDWVPTPAIEGLRKALSGISKLTNHVDWRLGRPYRGLGLLDAIRSKAVAGDVLLTHTDYNLCNTLIPGQWDHACLFTGWGSVVEATGEGVHESHLERVLGHCDDAVLLRPAFPTPAQVRDAVVAALSQVGKPYDYEFEFRLEGDRSFYCSELVWWAYSQAMRPAEPPFHPRKILGAWTVTPQDIKDNENFRKVTGA